MPTTVQIALHSGETLLDGLRRKGVFIPAPCGGKGICGRCRVEVEGAGWIQACGFHAEQEIRITVPDVSPMQILTESFWPDPEPAFDPAPTGSPYNLGLAVDIGTTTVVVFLEDLNDHRNLGIASFPNPQQAYGADVISRIHFCIENEDGTRQLQQEILKAVSDSAKDLCLRLDLDPSLIERVTMAGNTTMQHLVKGVNPESLSLYPFRPVFLSGQRLKGLLPGFPGAQVQLLPSLASYIGADIVAGFACVAFTENTGWNLFLDIGTNGEIVLWNRSRILTCATAAGPAFEGARISCGMPGVEGAICAIHPDGFFETIGNKPPAGLCGSGLVDAVALMLNNGMIDSTGYLEEETPCVAGHTSSITLIPQDIREVQLAKGAIAAGVEILLAEAGIRPEDISRVYLAGGFGYALHDWSVARISLLPPGLEKRLIRAGNTAGLGARLWLHSGEFRDHAVGLIPRMEYVELSSHADFNDRFMLNIGFR